MFTKTYEAEVLDDGHLSVAEDVRLQLGLKKGDRVEVTIRRNTSTTRMRLNGFYRYRGLDRRRRRVGRIS